jgi:hypothetical protein
MADKKPIDTSFEPPSNSGIPYPRKSHIRKGIVRGKGVLPNGQHLLSIEWKGTGKKESIVVSEVEWKRASIGGEVEAGKEGVAK